MQVKVRVVQVKVRIVQINKRMGGEKRAFQLTEQNKASKIDKGIPCNNESS